jgi:uroporphyrinogen decarboxylase
MTFQPIDRIPLMEMGYWEETFERWHHEGLPPWVTSIRHMEDYLHLDRSFNLNWLPIYDNIYPPFTPEVIEEDQETLIVRDELGVVSKQKKRHRTIPHYIRFPVADPTDYEGIRPRLNGSAPGRYPQNFDEDLRWRRERGEIVGLSFRSFFGFPRGLMGMEAWCMAFYDQPSLVRRIIADRAQFGKDLLKRVLATEALDFVQVWEDMSYKTAPMISPHFVRELMLPAYQDLVSCLRKGGVQVIMVDTDGRVEDLLPVFLEAGMDGTHPCEMAAGSDPITLRQKHPRSALMGGLDKRKIAAGKAGIDSELKRIKPLLREGGYIPMLDHFVPPDVSYKDYLYYVEKRRELLGGP